MVKVTKDGKVRELANDLVTSVFIRDGWKVVKDVEPVAPVMTTPEVAEPEEKEEPVVEAPKRRGRRSNK